MPEARHLVMVSVSPCLRRPTAEHMWDCSFADSFMCFKPPASTATCVLCVCVTEGVPCSLKVKISLQPCSGRPTAVRKVTRALHTLMARSQQGRVGEGVGWGGGGGGGRGKAMHASTGHLHAHHLHMCITCLSSAAIDEHYAGFSTPLDTVGTA